MSRLAIEYDSEWPMPRISVGNSSAVIVHGMVSRPSIELHTYNRMHNTGTQEMFCSPCLIHSVTSPEKNMHSAMPSDDTMMSGRRRKRFSSHAFRRDMTNRVTPTKIDEVYASIVVPTSYKVHIIY